MAVPTIVSVSPSSGHPVGGIAIEIIGTGFRLPTEDENSVAVSFDGVFSERVEVISTTRLFATVPEYTGSVLLSSKTVAVDVLVKNVDSSGVDIAGETVTSSEAFSYTKPDYSTNYESEIKLVVGELIRKLKRQLVNSVAISTHPDYESNGANVHAAVLPTLPGIVLIGPDFEENRFYSTNEEIDVDDESTDDVNGHVEFDTAYVPYTVDFLFTFYGFSNSKMELMNFRQACVHFFKRNTELPITIGSNTAPYELDLTEDFRSVGTPGDSNLHCFSGQVIIRGVNLHGTSGLGDPLETERKSRGIYTDEQGAEIELEQTSEDPPLVVRSILS